MSLIISSVYTDSRFLELSEFELKSELEKELWRRLDDLYAEYVGENTDYKGMSYEDIILTSLYRSHIETASSVAVTNGVAIASPLAF